jgi:hypothetical protein
VVIEGSSVSLLPDRADAGPTGEEAAVPTDCLPDNPDIEQLKGNAKTLRTDTSTPAVRSAAMPRPATCASGSSTATMTRRTPAAMIASVHGGVRP